MTLTLAPETEARLQAAAARKGLAVEEVIDTLLRYDLAETSGEAMTESETVQDTAEQARLRTALFNVAAKAQALTPIPSRPGSEQTEEERMFGEIIAEKYRKQGFNLP